ncbi:unnamed protein product [Phytophthora fragariaefolia]|uniref:Unnamed protein product n=1 Tax=Phytophthora fragariaefolia TaxID=1490495 RepID=A0A9W7CU54_9STRA|nr:unnamed protein product [Phytophthora fragariaefolia]
MTMLLVLREMGSRNNAGPPPPGLGPGRHSSPRRHVVVRLPTSVPANSVSVTQHQGHLGGSTYPSAMLAPTTPAALDAPNPQIKEIQSRVEELIRRYDDAMAAAEQEELKEQEDDAFDDKVRTPARWRVGDVLLATHRALARTSTHTERTIIAEFGDDPEVSAAIGGDAQKVGDAFAEAAEQAVKRHRKLSHIQQALHSVAANGMQSDDSEDDDEPASHAIRERQLRNTIDALHREKELMATQLHDALRAQQESRVATEQLAQELAKAQRAVRAQSEELRITQENNEKAAEAANTLTASWRDKFQASAKAAAAAEAKVQELESKVRAQSEEIVKHNFVLQAKIQEMERFKESEAARSRAEAAAQAAALAEAEAEARRAKAKANEEKRKSKVHADGNSKGMQEMEDKIREIEGALLAAERIKEQLEADNNELTQRIRDLQARFGELRKFKPSAKEEVPKEVEARSAPVSTFALRLRESTPRVNARKRKTGEVVSRLNSRPAPTVPVTPPKITEDDDLSSSDSETEDTDNDAEIDEVEKDERELNGVMQQVVASVFPLVSSAESDANVDESIAVYEDPGRSPLSEIQPSPVVLATLASSGDMVPRSELDTLRSMYDHEVDCLKQQYVDGLHEYKRLVLEQYGRRQVIERERHRMEVEGLLRLIQTKFHAELARRSGRLKRAKASLKVLYSALRQHTGPALEPQDYEEDPSQPYNPAMPLKTLLKAAILAMSTSAKRSGRGHTQIEAIHEQLTRILPPPDTRTRAVAAAMTIHSAIHADKPRDVVTTQDVWCQTDAPPRERRVEVAPTEPRVAPESLEGYVLPGSPCFPSCSKVQPKTQQQKLLVMLHLVVGTPISGPLVSELRRCLPNLPPGNYYVSSALRIALFHELVRFYAAVAQRAETGKTQPAPRASRRPEGEDHVQEAEVVVGSPRDTPFLRRKALETIESKSRRRHLFASGGVAILGLTSTATRESALTHNDGTTSTLLNLEGTIPIFYRSNQYNIPVEFWVVETYPLAPPVCFVRPTADMMVKPGHPHVTSDGYVKIPYTSDWRPDFTLLELVAHMCSIFGNMPPVFRRPANARPAPRLNGSAGGSGAGGYFQQGAYAQAQPSPYYSPQFQRGQDLAASGGPRETESLFGSSQQSMGASTLSSSGTFGRMSGEMRPEERATALKAEITGKIQMQLEKLFKRVRDDIDLQFEHEVQLTQSRENVERGLQSLRFLRDDITRAKSVVETQDKEISAWLEENEGKDTVDPDTILVEGDALSKQYVFLLALV